MRVLGDSDLFEPLKKNGVRTEQTYTRWKLHRLWQKIFHPRRQSRRVICLQPLGGLSIASETTGEDMSSLVVDRLKSFVEAFFFGVTVEVLPALALDEVRCDRRIHERTNRVQWLVTDLLLHLKRIRPQRAFCIVGITAEDLYPSEEWNFVLGHALWTSSCAVISIGRYASDDPSKEMTVMGMESLTWRLVRVATHEICHLFGIDHCSSFACAMNCSSSVLEAESQPLVLCPLCLRKLQRALRFQLQERYVGLAALCQEMTLNNDTLCIKSVNSDHHRQLPVVPHQTREETSCSTPLKPGMMTTAWSERMFAKACQWLNAAVGRLRGNKE